MRNGTRTGRQSPLGPLGLRAASALGFRQLRLLAATVDRPRVDATPILPAGVTVGELTAGDLPTYSRFRSDTPQRILENRFTVGETCICAWADGRLAATMWVARGAARIAFLQVRMELEATEAYLFDAFTAPDWRGRGLAPALSGHILDRLASQRGRRALRATFAANAAALRAHAKSGFTAIGTIGSFTLGPWQWRFARGDLSRPLHRWRP